MLYLGSCDSLATELVQFKADFWPHLSSSLLNFWCYLLVLPPLKLSFISVSGTVDSPYLKTTCLNLRLPDLGHSHIHSQRCTEQGKMWVPWCTSSQPRSNKATPPSCCSSSTVNKCSLCGLFRATFVEFLFFLLVIVLFKMALQHPANVLSSVSKCRKAFMLLTEKKRVRLASFRPEL